MTAPVFNGINHICVVTRDVDRAVRVWFEKYGVGPWRVFTFDTDSIDATVDGAPTQFAMRVGLCHFDPTTRLEIIQPLDDASPYAHALTARGDADHIHHVRLDVADYDDAMAEMGKRGNPTLLDGRFRGGTPGSQSRATYFDTEADVGFIVEVADVRPGWTMIEPDYVLGEEVPA
jgi:methylmalonyl-CoA/ethylmalonyl-CoA epimerase